MIVQVPCFYHGKRLDLIYKFEFVAFIMVKTSFKLIFQVLFSHCDKTGNSHVLTVVLVVLWFK